MRVVLDPDRATSAIDRAWPRLGLRGLAITSARYEAGKSCLVAYMLETPDGRQPAYIKVTADPAPRVDFSDVMAALPALSGVVCRFPADLGLTLAGRPGDTPEHLRIITYRPERRLTARVERGGHPAVLRTFCEGHYRAPRAAPAREHRVPEGVRVAKVIESSVTRRTVVAELLIGHRLSGLLGAQSAAVLLRHTGEALATLHRATLTACRPAPPASAAPSLRAAEDVSILAPPLMDLAAGLARRLIETVPPPVAWSASCATNLHPGNVILGEGCVGLATAGIDASGDPAADIGSMLGHLESHFAGQPRGLEASRALSEEFIAGYRAAGGRIEAQRVRWHAAAVLLRQAREPFVMRAPDWPRQLRLHLERAREFAAEL